MPIFQYECPYGHVVEQLVGQREVDLPKVRSMPCYTCSAEGVDSRAKKILSATPTTFRMHDTKAFKT